MATIRPLRNKWQAIIRRTGYPALYKTFDLKKDAERWSRETERDIDSGKWLDRTEAKRTTLSGLLDRYAKEVSTTKRGCHQELQKLAYFKKHSIAKYSVAAITSKLIAEWRD